MDKTTAFEFFTKPLWIEMGQDVWDNVAKEPEIRFRAKSEPVGVKITIEELQAIKDMIEEAIVCYWQNMIPVAENQE